MATGSKPHHRKFPREIARFFQLEGGQYGTVDLVALTAHVLELQTGSDFVQFTREQAADLRDALQRFLELGEHEPGEQEAVEVVAEVIERNQAGRRRRARASAG
jgi:hypothetical protein